MKKKTPNAERPTLNLERRMEILPFRVRSHKKEFTMRGLARGGAAVARGAHLSLKKKTPNAERPTLNLERRMEILTFRVRSHKKEFTVRVEAACICQ
jgi:hypothetical protein